MKGILEKTNGLIIGPMEEDLNSGRNLRKRVKENLATIGINIWDHYSRPFVDEIEESEITHDYLNECRKSGRFDEITKLKAIRGQDLRLVDTADFIICVFEKKTFSVGTWNEFFVADQLKKPIFFVWGEGKQKCPFWIFWTIPHSYIYSSVEECLETIREINNGKIKIDSKRWKLKKYEYR